MQKTVDTMIIGGGLSGLAVADELARAGRDFIVLEARDRPGGRVLSERAGDGRFDLGPAWIWPENTQMRQLITRLALPVFPQYAKGNLVFEEGHGRIRRDLNFATMGNALRVAGGLSTLTEGLAALLSPEQLRLSHRVTAIHREAAQTIVEGHCPSGSFRVQANHLILALPPRIMASAIRWTPELPPSVRRTCAETPTWMAGHAKLVATYDRAFWREAGLSGDAISHVGPLMEIHDASDGETGVPALFGFVTPGLGSQDGLEGLAIKQLTRLFGPDAANPEAVLTKDWANDRDTAVRADRTPPTSHPHYGDLPPVIRWADTSLYLAGTELGRSYGGFLEGALEAAEAALGALLAEPSSSFPTNPIVQTG